MMRLGFKMLKSLLTVWHPIRVITVCHSLNIEVNP
jgi:hypothetical protein